MLTKEQHALFALLLILFIDGMGQGLIFPILTNVIINPASHVVLSSATIEERNIWYGVIICSFFFTWFFGAAILGDISDRAGRKKALALCLLGATLGYLASALAFYWHTVWLLLLGRIIYGFTAGSQPIAQACIADISLPENKARNMGFILLALTLGIMSGPIIGGFLSDYHLVSWFKDSTPLYFACLLSLFNLCYLLLYFHETSGKSGALHLRVLRAVDIFMSAFKDQSVRYLSMCFTILQIGWSIYYLYITLFLTRKYAMSAAEIAVFFALIGLGLTLGFAFLVKYFTRFTAKNVVMTGYGVMLLGIVVTLVPENVIYPWIAVVPATAGLATGYAYIMTLFSNQVGPERQGWVMGVSGALVAFSAGIAILISTLLSDFNITFPLIVAILFLLIGCILIYKFEALSK